MIANSQIAWSERAATAASSHEAALWSQRGQIERFASVLAALNPKTGESLLDYGCGTGALSEFLRGCGYLGYDSSPGMFERARREHPGVAFTCYEPTARFDLTACIGTFNLLHEWSKKRTWVTLGRLWGRTRRALAVCLYAGDDRDCIRYTERECRSFGETTGAHVTVKKHRPNDILLVLERT